MSINILDKIKEGLGEALDGILENNTQLIQLKEVKRVMDLYRQTDEAKKQPRKFEAIFINDMKERILETILEEFTATQLLESVYTIIISTGRENVDLDFDLGFDLPTLKTHVDFDMVVNQIVLKNVLTLAFKLDSKVRLEGISIRSNGEEKRAIVRRMVISARLDLLQPMIIGTKRIKIGEKQFTAIENLELRKTAEGIDLKSN